MIYLSFYRSIYLSIVIFLSIYRDLSIVIYLSIRDDLADCWAILQEFIVLLL